MRLIQRETLQICGYVAETDATHNAEDLSALYRDFFDNDRQSLLRGLHGGEQGLYGLMWYTQGKERYCYLLGMQVGADCAPPAGCTLKTVPQATYAVARYPREKDAIEAWSEFFFTDIPGAGYAPNEQLNLYFEYFPEGAAGAYELWVPVLEADGAAAGR